MKNLFLGIFAFSLFLFSCTKENEDLNKVQNPETIINIMHKGVLNDGLTEPVTNVYASYCNANGIEYLIISNYMEFLVDSISEEALLGAFLEIYKNDTTSTSYNPGDFMFAYHSDGLKDVRFKGNTSYFSKYLNTGVGSNFIGAHLADESEGETYELDFTVTDGYVEGSFSGMFLDETLSDPVPISGEFVAEILKTSIYCD